MIGCVTRGEDVGAVVTLEPVTDIVLTHELQIDEFVLMITPGADIRNDGPVRIHRTISIKIPSPRRRFDPRQIPSISGRTDELTRTMEKGA